MARVRSKSTLKSLMGKVQKSLSLWTRKGVPGDVKEGHFAVHAIKCGELQRFIVGLNFLRSPDFLRLLEQAEEEFGFKQEGTLVIPCHPNDLQRVLESRGIDFVQDGSPTPRRRI